MRTAEGIERRRVRDRLLKRRLRAADPESHRSEVAASRRRNRSKVNRRQAEMRAADPERFREYARRDYQAHPDRYKGHSQTRKARLRGATRVRSVRRAVVLRIHGGICGICGLPVNPRKWHLDHIWPLAVGGWHDYDNVQPAHPFCNISKKDGWILNGAVEAVLVG